MIKGNDTTQKKVAEFLLQIKAIKLQPHKPFTWVSGWKSPLYCDNRVTLSYPKIRTYIRQEFAKLITDNFGKPDIIAGVATGAIAQGVLVAQELNLPFIYVRPDAKKHGLGNQIEGYFEPNQSVVIVEDLISTGGSSLNAVAALKEAKLEVKGMVAIFTYQFKEAELAFKKSKCILYTLSNYQILLQQAIDSGFLNQEEVAILNDWHEDPENWK